jgi:ATP-dependent DNA helicase DinG
VAAPLSVAEDLRRMFYEVKDSVVLCSATLRVGNDFKYMAKRLGCGGGGVSSTQDETRFRFLTAASPFDYFRQALVLAPDCLPDPSVNPVEYAGSLALLMRDLFSVTRGRALVLFTSYEMMNAVAATAHQLLADAGITLLVQGEGLSRESMTRHLKEDSDTVVFGAQSFWEGVDVAGDALSCVVLARLPFPQKGEPVTEARSEQIEENGGSSFRDYMVPEAVIKFRQGFGRLIRTKSDRGVVIVADPRIVTKNYGAVFRKSIPATVHTVSGESELLERTGDFFA